MGTIEEFKKDKQELANKIEELIHEFEKKYNSYVREINLVHQGDRYCDGRSDYRIDFVNIKTEFND